MEVNMVFEEFMMCPLRKNPISLGKTTEMIGEKVEHCCRWIQEEEIIGIAESLQGGGSSAGSSGGSW